MTVFNRNFRLSALLLAASLVGLTGCSLDEPHSSAAEAPSPATSSDSSQTVKAPDPNWPRLRPPVECNFGEDCFIMLYPDRDLATSEFFDFGCGRQTYDGHKGTDFAVSDAQAMERGVPVVAAAPGQVLRLRDGEPDRRVTNEAHKASVEGKECGNGVVIGHGDGWETQYCHLKQGSVVVQQGDRVEAGTVLGMVGMSGLASFPHVHLSVRQEGEVVDPFVGPGADASCEVTRRPLWSQSFDYDPTGLVRAGFADRKFSMNDLWEGDFSQARYSEDIPVLLFWVQAYGVLEGDMQHFTMYDPDGAVIAKDENEIDNSSLVWMSYVGKRNTQQRPIQPGTWRGEYRLTRDGRTIFEVEREIEVTP